MRQEQYYRSIGTDIAGVTRLHASFVAHINRWTDCKFGCDDDDSACAGYWIGYPCFLELIGHEWRKDTARADAYHALSRVHTFAVQHLMELAERFDIDSGPLWSAGTVCRALFADEPWKYYLDPDAFWPQCLGAAMATLPNDTQTVIRSGETTFMRLMAKADIDIKDGTGVVARWLAPVLPRASQRAIATRDDRWSRPNSPSQWAKVFGFSVDTLKRRAEDGTIRAKKLSPKSWCIHVDDLPADSR